MKAPTPPHKPYPPHKPLPPTEVIVQNISLGSFEIEKYGGYSLESFVEMVKSHASSVDEKNIQFEFEVEQTPTYYDETIIEVNVNVFTETKIPNPNFDRLSKQFEEDMIKYDAAYKKYKAALKRYKIEEKLYKVKFDEYLLEHAKQQTKRLEAKLKK